MPELPEVEITKQKLLDRKIIGKTIAVFETTVPKSVFSSYSLANIRKDIQTRKIQNLERKGKTLFFTLLPRSHGYYPADEQHKSAKRINKGRGHTYSSESESEKKSGVTGFAFSGEKRKALIFHLRMSGRLALLSEDKEMELPYIRTQILFKDGSKLVLTDPRKFGTIWYDDFENIKNYPYLASLGPDMANITSSIFQKRILKYKGIIKGVLLNQKAVSGIGNIIADEALWHARIHPQARIFNLGVAALKRLHKSLGFIIKRILSAEGTTLRDWADPEGRKGSYALKRFAYGRSGEKCPRCGSVFKRARIAGRGTSFCPICQKK